MEDTQNLIQSAPNTQTGLTVPLQPLAGQAQPPPQLGVPYYPQPAYPVSGKDGREHWCDLVSHTPSSSPSTYAHLRGRWFPPSLLQSHSRHSQETPPTSPSTPSWPVWRLHWSSQSSVGCQDSSALCQPQSWVYWWVVNAHLHVRSHPHHSFSSLRPSVRRRRTNWRRPNSSASSVLRLCWSLWSPTPSWFSWWSFPLCLATGASPSTPTPPTPTRPTPTGTTTPGAR